MNLYGAPSPFLSLSLVIKGLRDSLGGWSVRGLLSVAVVLLLYRRLGDIGRKMERLAARFKAGRLWRRAPRVVADQGDAPERGPGAERRRDWPREFGWLVRAASYQAAGYGSQLREILGQPEMVALLIAAPQAARVLRPLCRMLAIETSLLRPGEVAGPATVAAKRVRKPRVPIDWGRVPLPRGVLTAARRRGFAKG